MVTFLFILFHFLLVYCEMLEKQRTLIKFIKSSDMYQIEQRLDFFKIFHKFA